MESAVKNTFSDYIILTEAPLADDAGVDFVLTARWLGLESAVVSGRNWEILMFVEWTLARRDGAIVWMKPVHGTVTGSAMQLEQQVGLILDDLKRNSIAAFRSWLEFL